MLAELHTLLSTPWIRPRGRLLDVVELLTQMDPGPRSMVVDELAAARSDSAPALWLAERLRESPFRPDQILAAVSDLSWAETTALELTDAGVVGIVSMGEGTRACIATLVAIRSELPVIRAPSGVISRGVDDLGVISEIGDPCSADRCLVPVAATAGKSRMWTSGRGADAIRRHPNRVVVLDDPICRLSGWGENRWRPSDWLTEVALAG